MTDSKRLRAMSDKIDECIDRCQLSSKHGYERMLIDGREWLKSQRIIDDLSGGDE